MGSGFEFNGIFLFFIVLLVLLFLGLLATIAINYFKKSEDGIEDYINGLEAITDGNNRMAIQKLKNAIRKNTENVEAYIRLGDLLRKEGLAANALKIHKELLLRTNLSKPQRGRLYRALAVDYKNAGKYDLALKYANLYIKEIDAKDSAVLKVQLELFENLKKWNQAFQLLKSAPELIPDQKNRLALYKVMIGDELVKEKKEKDARISYKEALKQEEYNAAAYLGIGDSYWREERKEEAVDYWVELAGNNPRYAFLTFSRLEKAWFEMGEFANMQVFYQSLIRKYPELVDPVVALSRIHLKKGEYDEALKLVEALLKKNPGNSLVIALKLKIQIGREDIKTLKTECLEFLDTFFLKKKTDCKCSVCGYVSDKEMWHCPKCNAWNSFV
jgi:lipopolysaccharide biosynthesis regulator YciM